MLESIRELEAKMDAEIAEVRERAAAAIQSARVASSDTPAQLEDTLRAEESTAISAAEAAAHAEAKALYDTAKQHVKPPDEEKIAQATEHIVSVVLHQPRN